MALIAIPALSAAAAPAGSVAAGEALFAKMCAACHTVERLAGLGGLVRNDMREIDPRMATLGILWDADVANLGVYLNSVAASGLRGKQQIGRTAPGRRTQWRQ